MPNRNSPLISPLKLAVYSPEVAYFCQDLPGTPDDFFPFAGGNDRFLGAFKNAHTQLFFQFLHHHAERRLRHKTALGCFGKVPQPVDGDNVFQLLQVHFDRLFLCKDRNNQFDI
ncbi:MAG: hypothetical protein IPL27_16080 [Lewinellaceae bacterium]|nr:hypothetical protein [Lewinellaceae bacterium]